MLRELPADHKCARPSRLQQGNVMRHPISRSSLPRVCASALLLALLTACGGGGGGSGQTSSGGVVVTPPPPTTLRGTLIGSAAAVPVTVNGASVLTLQPAAFAQLLEAAQKGSTTLTGTPTCAVTTFTLKYHTVGSAGEDTDAATAIMVPSGTDSACQGNRPVLLYAHGTSVLKRNDMSDLSAAEPRLVAALYAAQGYIVVAPDYAGYAGSSLSYHAYLDAGQQASDMVDGLRAARKVFDIIGAHPSSRLLLTGYSQGGYVALATQRAMQTGYPGEFTVAAAAPMSGPYALTQFGDAIFGGQPTQGSAAFLPMLINAGQHANAGLYTSTSDVYEAPYATGIADLLPGASSLGDLVAAGTLPNDVLFAATSLPQGDGYASFFGAGNLVRTSYRDGYLADMNSHPCGVNSADPLNCAPTHALRKWLLKNDLRNYVPAVPTLLCGGAQDPVVPFRNATATADYFQAHGMSAASLTLLDLESGNVVDSYGSTRLAFEAAKALLRAASGGGAAGDQAVRASYHAGLVAPFCMRAARDFFQNK
jgi:alpha-beta hydrolase superfamily lysophospholipase